MTFVTSKFLGVKFRPIFDLGKICKNSQYVANATAIPFGWFKMFLIWYYTHWNGDDAKSFCFRVKFMLRWHQQSKNYQIWLILLKNGLKMLPALWLGYKKTKKRSECGLIDVGMEMMHKVFVFMWSLLKQSKN